MSYFQPIIWCAIGAVDPHILLKAYPREKLFNPIIVRSVARYLIRTATAIAGRVRRLVSAWARRVNQLGK